MAARRTGHTAVAAAVALCLADPRGEHGGRGNGKGDLSVVCGTYTPLGWTYTGWPPQ